MRFIFFTLFLLVLIVLTSVITVNQITASAVTKVGCQSPCTIAFYRTPEERQEVRRMWQDAGFVWMGVGPLPGHGEGRETADCMCPMTFAERHEATFDERRSVIREGYP